MYLQRSCVHQIQFNNRVMLQHTATAHPFAYGTLSTSRSLSFTVSQPVVSHPFYSSPGDVFKIIKRCGESWGRRTVNSSVTFLCSLCLVLVLHYLPPHPLTLFSLITPRWGLVCHSSRQSPCLNLSCSSNMPNPLLDPPSTQCFRRHIH
jgi:hypothetical protein